MMKAELVSEAGDEDKKKQRAEARELMLNDTDDE